MSEEEKKAIEKFKQLIFKHNYREIILEDSEGWTTWNELFETILNLIVRLQKENEDLEEYIKEQIERINNINDPTLTNLGERYAYENVLRKIWEGEANEKHSIE